MKTPLAQLIDLTGKTALVTGGAMGIGFGIAYRLAEAGANVVIADINEEAGVASTARLQERGFKATFIKTDVANEQEIQNATQAAAHTYGSLDILVNNAGVYPFISTREMTVADFERIMAVNLKSAFLFSKYGAELMIEQGHGGKIINITSIDAVHPSSIGLAAYDASKHGMWGLTMSSALEFAPYGIHVNAIAPGGITTPGTGANAPATPAMKAVRRKFLEKIPMGRFGESDDIGKVALFLASDLSSYMTGAHLVVDGGVLLS